MRIGHSSARALALGAGALFPLGFAPFSLWVMPLVSLAVLFALLNWRPGFWLGWWFGLGQFGIGVSWVYVSMTVHGGASPLLGGTLTGLFAGVLALFPGLVGMGFARWQQHWPHLIGRVALWATLWCTLEALRSWFLTGFPWLLLGHSALDSPWAGWLPWIGTYGVSALMATTAALVVISWQQHRWLVMAGGLLGSGLLLPSADTRPGDPLSIALWQPMIVQAEKWTARAQPRIIADHLRLGLPTDAALIVWPETALPMTEAEAGTLLSGITTTLHTHDQGLLTGVLGEYDGRYTNRFIGVGAASGTYDKSRLVPFGEYVPLESLLRGLIAFFDLPMSVIVPGPEQGLFQFRGIALAPLICYEIAYSGLARSLSRDAEVIVTISNDTWFGASIGPDQHLEIARIRAAELGKPVIRATNDGLTASIDAQGRVIDQLPRFTQAVLATTTTPHSGESFYGRAGEAPLVILLVVFLTLTRQISGQMQIDSD